MDSERLLHDISEELSHLFRDCASTQPLLDKAVEMLVARTQSRVCSVYLYNSEDCVLTLRATRGLNPESVGYVRLKLGEGLTGLALREMRTVCEENASRNPNYRFFPGIFEEHYDTFLAVPIASGICRMGVLVLQRGKGESFGDADIATLEKVASLLSSVIENAQFLFPRDSEDSGREKELLQSLARVLSTELKFDEHPELKLVESRPVREGVAYGEAVVLDNRKRLLSYLNFDSVTEYSLQDFYDAVRRTTAQLKALQGCLENRSSGAASLILATRLTVIEDRAFVCRIVRDIGWGYSPLIAVLMVATEYIKGLRVVRNAHMCASRDDIVDVVSRLLDNLLGVGEDATVCTGRVVIARELFPSDLAKIASQNASAVVLIGGEIPPDISVLARSLQIPMVVSDKSELLDWCNWSRVLIDTDSGRIYVDPDDSVLAWVRPRSCPVNCGSCSSLLRTNRSAVFVGIGNGTQDENLYLHGILPAIEETGRTVMQPTKEESTDLCKICQQIQTSLVAIVDISAWSGNALFELGMIYGQGKQAILLKKSQEAVPVDLQGIEYVGYGKYSELRDILTKRLSLLVDLEFGAPLSLRDRCFKTGGKCSHSDLMKEDLFFVGMPFRAKFENPYEAAIKPALESQGLRAWKADEEPRTIDIMCKVCQGIQRSRGAILNLTTWNPNVLFELGLVTALGKPRLLIRERDDSSLGELHPLEHVSYSDFGELKQRVERWLSKS